ETVERIRQELALQLALGAPLLATRGYAASEVEQTYARARELCRQSGEILDLFPALWGLWSFYLVRAQHEAARELGQQLLQMAQNTQDPTLRPVAHWALGVTLLHTGEFALAREHLEQMIAFYKPQRHHTLTFLYGTDPGVACQAWDAWALWLLGYPDQALQRSQEALILAQELSHPFSLAFALAVTTIFHQFRREVQLVLERAEAT